MSKYYLTTPIYYVNAQPHIGHVYTTVAADALARWFRLQGREVFFLTGTDEHGSKIENAAREAGISPGEMADRMSKNFRDLWVAMEIKPDRFIRTTEPEHQRVVQRVFLELSAGGDIYPGVYEGYYCFACEAFLTPSQGSLCPDCGRETEKISEPTYFFRLSRYQEPIRAYFQAHPEMIQPERAREEVSNLLNQPLPDVSCTRRCAWGIPLPAEMAADPELTIYVWFDALLNYLSGVDYGQEDGRFKKTWPPDIQLLGKDIIRFHYIIWPALLLALGLPLPEKLFAHGWWLSGGEKMSKSRGNVVEPMEFARTYGVDALRYFLLAEVPFGLDGDFNEAAFRKRYNSDLANDLGNLVHRFAHLIRTRHQGRVPEAGDGGRLAEKVLAALPQLDERMAAVDFFGFLETARTVVTAANHYLDETAPWRPENNSGPVLYNLAETARLLSLCLEPVMPRTSGLIRSRLGLEKLPADSNGLRWGLTPAGAAVGEGAPLFPRLK